MFKGEVMSLYEIGEQVKLIFEIAGKIRRCQRRFGNYLSKEVIVKIDNNYHIFDFEREALKRIDIKSIPYYYLPSSDGLRLVWIKNDEVTVSEMKNNRVVVEKVWLPKMEGFKIYMVFPSGVVVYNKKDHEVLRFEKLKKK